MPGLANFIIDHINRGIAGDITGQVQQGQMSPADAAAAYTQQTGLPAGDLFGGAQQSALAKLATNPDFMAKPYQGQLQDLAQIDPANAMSNLQALTRNKAMWSALAGGTPAPQGSQAVPQSGGSAVTPPADSSPGLPVPQGYGTVPQGSGQAGQSAQGSPLAGLAQFGARTGLFSPGDAMSLVAKQTEMAKQQADTLAAQSQVPKNQAEANKAVEDAKTAMYNRGLAPDVVSPAPITGAAAAGGAATPAPLNPAAALPPGSPLPASVVSQAAANPLNLFTRIQAAENAPADPKAAGDGGQATGLMQTHAGAFAEGAARAGIQNPDPTNQAHQMLAGIGYAQNQLDKFGGDPVRAAIGYNNPSVAQQWDGNIDSLPPGSKSYLYKVFPELAPQDGAGGAALPAPAANGAGVAPQTAPEPGKQPVPPHLLASDGKPFVSDIASDFSPPDPSGLPHVNIAPQAQSKLGMAEAEKNMGARIDAINKGNEAFTTSLGSLQTEQYRLKELANIYQQSQAGTATAQNIDLVNKAIGLGLIKSPDEIKDVGNLQAATGNAIMQIINQVKDTNNNMGAAPTRLFGSEINEMLEKGGDNIGSQPAALNRLIAEGLGFVNHHIDMVNGWTAIGGPGNRLQDGTTMLPDDYAQKFMETHDLGDYEKLARQQIGSFKGMAPQAAAPQAGGHPITKSYVRGPNGSLVAQ